MPEFNVNYYMQGCGIIKLPKRFPAEEIDVFNYFS